MARHSLGILIAFLIPAILATAILSPAEEPAFSWNVDANGAEGQLYLFSEPGGRVRGALLGNPVEGWLVGRHLVLFREATDGRETWEAWLATPDNVRGGALPILAGTFLRQGEDEVLPWFGTPQPQIVRTGTPLLAPLATGATEQPSTRRTPEPQTPVPPSPTVKTLAPQPERNDIPLVRAPGPVPLLPSGKPSLSGTWNTPDGPLTIRQEGSGLAFILPDREVSGRLTGVDSLIGGFGPGCCKGHLKQGSSVIVWDNGISWQRK